MIRLIMALEARMIREALADVLAREEDLRIISAVDDGWEAVRKATTTGADVIVLGWFLPRLNGVEATGQITRHAIRPRVILLSSVSAPAGIVHALRAGASAIVSTESPVSDLPRIVRQVAGGATFLSCKSSSLLANILQNKVLERDGVLSVRERELLQLIAEGYTNRGAAKVLGISIKTANNHRTRLMDKLDAHNTATLTRCAIRLGILPP